MRKLLASTIAVGLLSLAAFVFERLALTDIFHGEPDLHLEWGIVNAALIPLTVFHILALVTLAMAWWKVGRAK